MRGRQFGWGIHVDDPAVAPESSGSTLPDPDLPRTALDVPICMLVEPLTIRVVEHEERHFQSRPLRLQRREKRTWTNSPASLKLSWT